MKRKSIITAGLVVLLAAFLCAPALAKDVTVVGEINDEFQLVTEDAVYDIAEGEVAEEMVTKHISQMVEVTGSIEKDGDQMVITVKSYKAKEE